MGHHLRDRGSAAPSPWMRRSAPSAAPKSAIRVAPSQQLKHRLSWPNKQTTDVRGIRQHRPRTKCPQSVPDHCRARLARRRSDKMSWVKTSGNWHVSPRLSKSLEAAGQARRSAHRRVALPPTCGAEATRTNCPTGNAARCTDCPRTAVESSRSPTRTKCRERGTESHFWSRRLVSCIDYFTVDHPEGSACVEFTRDSGGRHKHQQRHS